MNKYYFLIKNNLNIYTYIPSIYGLFLGDYLKPNYINYFFNINQIGIILPLLYIKISSVISNIKINKHFKYIKSNGTFGLLLSKKLDLNKGLILLPSSKLVYIHLDNYAIIGRNFNIYHNKQYLGGYGLSYKLGQKPTVRGVAMNPIDHPNGGRTKAKSPELSLWGWVAKHNK